MQELSKKEQICKTAGELLKKLRGGKSQFMFSSENDISISIVNTFERGLKDPQLTPVFRIAEGLNLKPSEFVRMIEAELPEDFYMIDK